MCAYVSVWTLFLFFFLCTADNRIRAPRTQWPGVIDCVFLSGRRENGDGDGDDEENNNKKNLIQKNIRHVDPGRGNRGSSTTHATWQAAAPTCGVCVHRPSTRTRVRGGITTTSHHLPLYRSRHKPPSLSSDQDSQGLRIYIYI